MLKQELMHKCEICGKWIFKYNKICEDCKERITNDYNHYIK